RPTSRTSERRRTAAVREPNGACARVFCFRIEAPPLPPTAARPPQSDRKAGEENKPGADFFLPPFTGEVASPELFRARRRGLRQPERNLLWRRTRLRNPLSPPWALRRSRRRSSGSRRRPLPASRR